MQAKVGHHAHNPGALAKAFKELNLFMWCNRDAVLLQHQCDLQCSRVKFSVFDNLLMVHHMVSGRIQIFDVAVGDSSVVLSPQLFAIAQLGVHFPYCLCSIILRLRP